MANAPEINFGIRLPVHNPLRKESRASQNRKPLEGQDLAIPRCFRSCDFGSNPMRNWRSAS